MKRRAFLRLCACALAPLALGGCEPTLVIKVIERGGQIVFQLGMPLTQGGRPSIGSFQVTELSRLGVIAWRIQAVSNQVVLKEVVYGGLPSGMKTIASPAAIRFGQLYRVSANDWGGFGGSVAYFVISGAELRDKVQRLEATPFLRAP